MATISEAFAIALKHHQAGQLAIAEPIYRQILKLDPNHFDTLHLLGVISHQTGRNLEAIEFFVRAIELNGNIANVYNNLGGAYLSERRMVEAVASYGRALQLNPNYAMTHSNLGNALLEQGKLENAIVSYRRAIELLPDFAEAHSNLGNALMYQGKLAEADTSCRKALELKPDFVQAHNNLGQVLHAAGNLDAALGWYLRGLHLDPNAAQLHYNLGRLLWEMDQPRKAIEHYARSLQLTPHFADAHLGLAVILHDQGDLEQAMKLSSEALRLRPGFAAAHCSVGTILQEQGDLEAAENSFREALRQNPDCVDAHAQLATLLRGKLPEVDQVAILRLAANPQLMNSKRMTLFFALAHVDDARHDYNTAAKELHEANSLSLSERIQRGIGYDSDEHDRFVTEAIKTFSSAYFERVNDMGAISDRPVFIVGLPRSGTSLIEQILASHSQVFGAGELGLIGSAFSSLPQITSRDTSASDSARFLDSRLINEIAGRYLDRLAEFDAVALRVTDKMPDNYQYLGLIATIFPNAKIIHCRRDVRDIAVSCWMTNFRQIPWANHFDHIGSRFKAHERLMAHWHQTLPISILEIDYEETVSNVEAVARRLIHWCNLEWEPECASFHEKNRPVKTASSTQVRQAIYSSSVGRWKNYEQALAPLFAILPVKQG